MLINIHQPVTTLTLRYDKESTNNRPDLSAMKPLWQLYTTLMKDYGV